MQISRERSSAKTKHNSMNTKDHRNAVCPGKEGGGGDSHIKMTGFCSSEILKRIPKRYQDPVLWAWFEFFSPLRGANSKTTH